MKLETFAAGIGLTFILFFLFALIGLLVGWPTMWLTNHVFSSEVLVYLFGVPKIGFWKAYELYLLCAFLFRSSSRSDK